MEAQRSTPTVIGTDSHARHAAGRVVGVIEAKKEALLEKARAIAAGLLEADRRAAAERFITAFYEHVPPADVGERGPRDLCGAALSLWHFGDRRRPSHAKVRVYNPDRAADG